MNIVRTILAGLITVSLMLAPGLSARVAKHDNAAITMHASADAGTDATVGMSDCMKAMAGDAAAGDATKGDCKCCDTKSKCPDQANCMTKCCKVLGMVKPAGKRIALTTVQYRHAEPTKPPDWLSTPPAPPPRSQS